MIRLITQKTSIANNLVVYSGIIDRRTIGDTIPIVRAMWNGS